MISTLTTILGWIIYTALGAIALFGAYSVVVAWRRVAEQRFRSEKAQLEFLDTIDQHLSAADFDGIVQTCQNDPRAMSQLVLLAASNRTMEYQKLRHLVTDRFRRDVLAELDYRISWIQTVIRSAPMVGLLGTVVGMMGAFSKIAGQQNVETTALASDISLALITTACGLAIAIPLVLCVNNINVRIRKMEDLVGAGLMHFFENLKPVLQSNRSQAAPRDRMTAGA